MNAFTQAFTNFLPFLSIVLALCVTVGGLFAARNGQQTQLAKIQESANTALKLRIEVLEGRIADFERENVAQRHLLETIAMALELRGLIFTVDGDIVTIQDKQGTSQYRKRGNHIAHVPPTVKKEEEDNK